jgi:hypothetical protein
MGTGMRKITIAVFSVVLVLALAVTTLINQSISTPKLSIQVVDPAGTGGIIVFDSNDTPHIFYCVDEFFRTNRTGLNHAVWTGTKWNIEHLNDAVGNIFIMDTNNNPHVISTSNGTLKDVLLTNPVVLRHSHTSFRGKRQDHTDYWNIKDIGIAEVAGDTMALDSSGTLHEISADYIYFESNNSYTSHLYYKTWTKSGESVQTIAEVNSTAQVAYQRLYPQSIAIDTKGNPHVIFAEEHETVLYPLTSPPSLITTSTIKYAVWTGSNWTVQTLVTNTDHWSWNVNFVLDFQRQPHLCYLSENRTPGSFPYSYRVESSLEYMHFDGLTWVNQTIEPESSDDIGQHALRLDSGGNPQVYFFKENYQPTINYDLFYVRWNGTAWDIQKIWNFTPNLYGFAGFSTIAFDSYGNPRLTYAQVMGTIRSAPRYGNLTYVAIDMQPKASPLLTLTIVGSTMAIVAVILIIYFKKRRH